MQVEAMRKAYQSNKVVKAICDHMAQRINNQSETYVKRIRILLNNEGHDFSKTEIITAFRKLEETECGKFLRGHSNTSGSRFAWSDDSKLISRVAQGIEEIDQNEEEYEDLDDNVEGIVMIEHSYVLREDCTISFELPANLTYRESSRLSEFIGSLSFNKG